MPFYAPFLKVMEAFSRYKIYTKLVVLLATDKFFYISSQASVAAWFKVFHTERLRLRLRRYFSFDVRLR